MNQTSQTVLFISHDASRTGAPIFLLRFLRWFRQNHHIQFRVLVGHSGELLSDFESLGLVDSFEPNPTLIYRILRRLNLNGPRRSDHLASLRRKLLASDISLIYSNTMASGNILDFLSFLDCPVICHVHELESAICDSGIENLNFTKKRASGYIAVSWAVKTNLIEKHGISEDTIRMVHGFIPASECKHSTTVNSRAMVRRELGIPLESKLVCACGSIEPRKGVDLFLQVADKVAKAYQRGPVHFMWIGGRPEVVSRMRKQARFSSLRDIAHFIGPKPDVALYYDASDIFLLPSREDPFPLVMMEAALREMPIVCFDKSGGAAEFIEGDAGLVVPGFDVDQMAQKVVGLLSSPDLCKRLGVNARQKVLNRHDIGVGAPQIAAIIQGALLMRENRQDAANWLQTEQEITTKET